jgi:hypothetical protein
MYVGETDRLWRRLQHYRTPGPSQATNHRLNRVMTELLGEILVSIITDATIELDSERHALDLADKTARLLVESAALIATNQDRSRGSSEVRTRSKSSCRVQRKRELRLAGGGARRFEPATSTQTCRSEARAPACASESPRQVRGRSRRCPRHRSIRRGSGRLHASVGRGGGAHIASVRCAVQGQRRAFWCVVLCVLIRR